MINGLNDMLINMMVIIWQMFLVVLGVVLLCLVFINQLLQNETYTLLYIERLNGSGAYTVLRRLRVAGLICSPSPPPNYRVSITGLSLSV